MILNTNDYETEFAYAIERTDAWGMCAPYLKQNPIQHQVNVVYLGHMNNAFHPYRKSLRFLSPVTSPQY
ncbi:hypothetical protein EPK90_22840 (plasmid) [Pantoea ananatis]|nr:hypothetical protein EPK90_22840 [Pantoea ananatis]